MDLQSQLDEAYTTMAVRLDAYQEAIATFRQRPDDSALFRTAEEASFGLLNALVDLNKAIFNLHYSFGGNYKAVGERRDGQQGSMFGPAS